MVDFALGKFYTLSKILGIDDDYQEHHWVRYLVLVAIKSVTGYQSHPFHTHKLPLDVY